MMLTCMHCGNQFPPGSRFCAMCGQPLMPPPALPVSHGRRNLALLGVMAALIVSVGIGAAVISSKPSRPTYKGPLYETALHLPVEKAAAMYALLAPSDVRVIVGRHSNGVTVRGTLRENEVLERFAELLMRTPGFDYDHHRDALHRECSTYQTYRLPRSKAKSLKAILAFDDVPVLVSRDGRQVQVQASEEDQMLIAKVVAILLGDRLY